MAAKLTFDDLPPELVLMAFKNLPLASLKEARLVSRSWSGLAAEGVFRTCTINLVKKPGKSLVTIIRNPTLGKQWSFLENVRYLTVDFQPMVSHKEISFYSTEGRRLNRLLGSLKKHTLLSFTCAYLIESRVIHSLLMTQHRLGDLVTALSPPGSHGLPIRHEMFDGLSNIRRFELTMDRKSPDSYSDIQNWFINMPLLESLTYQEIARPPAVPINDWASHRSGLLLNFRSLCLRHLSFSKTAAILSTQLQLPSLRSLRIQYCKNCFILLNALTDAYALAEDRHLETFIYISARREDDSAAFTFLQPLRKLETIVLQSGAYSDRGLPVPGIFLQQGDGLQYLQVSALIRGVHYNATSLEALGRICSEVKVLGIDLVDIEDDIDDVEKIKDFVFPPRNEATDSLNLLKDLLKALTGFKKLRTLRINNDPIGPDYSPNRARYRHHQLATEIFKYLAKSGSSIRLLVFCPSEEFEVAMKDAWGHTWPQYAYRMGLQHPVGDTISEISAIPTTYEVVRSVEPLHEYLWEYWYSR